MAKSYFSLKKGIKLDKYSKAIETAQRQNFLKYAHDIASGYSKIVRDWDKNVKPGFKGRYRYDSREKVFYIYVKMYGSEKAKMIFRMIDFGAKRGQTVTAPEGVAHTLVEKIVKPPINFPRKVFADAPEEEKKEYRRLLREARRLQKASIRRAERAKKRGGPGRTKKGSRLGIQSYRPRTSMGGGYGGPGIQASGTPKKSKTRAPRQGDPNWRGIGQPSSIKLGEIKPRGYSIGLREYIWTGENLNGAKQIWGPKMEMKFIVQRGFRLARIKGK